MWVPAIISLRAQPCFMQLKRVFFSVFLFVLLRFVFFLFFVVVVVVFFFGGQVNALCSHETGRIKVSSSSSSSSKSGHGLDSETHYRDQT